MSRNGGIKGIASQKIVLAFVLVVDEAEAFVSLP